MRRCVKYLALIAAAAPLFPGRVSGACPIASDTNVVFYGETGAGGVDADSRSWLIHFLDWWKTQEPGIKYVELNSADLKTGCNLVDYPNVRVHVQPGGNAYQQHNQLALAGKTNINSYIDSGRVYVGICAGFYYAAENYYFAGVLYNYPYLLGKYPATVEGSITTIATYPAYSTTPVSGYTMIYYGGPTTGWSQTPSGPGEALLTYDAIPGLPAVIKYNNLLLAGPHPEAYEDEGITGLTTAQRTENYTWFANAIYFTSATISNPPFSSVSTASITANWWSTFPSGTLSGTTHYAQISTGAFPNTFSANLSSATFNPSAGFTGLWPNTTYYARVSIIDAAGPFTDLGSTSTLSMPVSGAQLYAVYFTSITANWLPLPASPPGTSSGTAEGYLLQISTDGNFAGPVYSSSTSNISLSTLAIAGLVPNTTYYSRVGSLNWPGAPNFTLLPSTITLANPPGDHSIPVLNLSSASLRFQWTENGNPAGTNYLARLSTGSGFTGSADRSSATTGASADFSGLTGNTAYYMKAQAIGRGGAPSGFGQLSSTITFPQVPVAGAFSAVTSSGLTAGWTAGTNDISGLSYTVQISTDGAFAPVMDSSGTLNTFASFGLGGQGPPLTPNTAYYLRVQAAGYSGSGPFAGLNSTVTLSNSPGQTSIIALTSATVNLDWSPNGNPEPGTGYEVWRDIQSGFVNPVKTAVPASALLISGLASKTTYYFKARAVNSAGAFSGFDGVVSTRTYPAPPGALVLSGTALGVSSVSWTWNDAGDEDGYRVINPADGNVSGVIAANVTNWPEIALSTNIAYFRKAAAFNISGFSTSTLVTRYTLAAPPTGFILTGVYFTSAAVQWAAGTNPAGTNYELKYWAAGGSTTTLTVAVTSAALTGLAGGTVVYALVRALNGDNLPTSYDTALSTLIPATVGTVSPDEDTLITFQGPSGEIKVGVPKNTFGETVLITVRTPAAQDCHLPTGGLIALATPVCVEIKLDKPLQPARPVDLSVSYRDGDLGGRDENKLILAYYDDAQSAWVPLFSGRDAAANKVTGKASHFSVFQIMQSDPAQDLSKITIGPNILRPGRYPGQFMTFRNLPAGARVRVYTLVGELLHDTAEDGTGTAVWNGKNRSGAQAASGIYLALIEAGAKKRVFRVAVER